MNYVQTFAAMAATMAFLGWAPEDIFAQSNKQSKNQLVASYAEIGRTSQRSSNFGWIPQNSTAQTATDVARGTGHDAQRARDYITAISQPARAKRRESLRKSWRNPYAWSSETPTQETVDCDCENCRCPPLICKRNHCKMNYVAVFSATWCPPCREMIKVWETLRNEGYLVYYYDVDKFEDIDAQFDVSGLPTFIIFDKGNEVKRQSGITPIQWFRDNLKTKSQQKSNLYEF